jgi:hypothetical protein
LEETICLEASYQFDNLHNLTSHFDDAEIETFWEDDVLNLTVSFDNVGIETQDEQGHLHKITSFGWELFKNIGEKNVT